MHQIYTLLNAIETEQNTTIRRSQKVTLYSMVKYLQAGHTGISKFDMENFLSNNCFKPIFQDLLTNTIIKENKNGYYILNEDFKDILDSLINNLNQELYYLPSS